MGSKRHFLWATKGGYRYGSGTRLVAKKGAPIRNRQVAEAKSSLGSTTFFGNGGWLPPDPPENEDVLLPKATK